METLLEDGRLLKPFKILGKNFKLSTFSDLFDTIGELFVKALFIKNI